MPDFQNYFTGVHHISFDLWLTLIRSHPDFKKERVALLQSHFDIREPFEEIHKTLRYYDVACNRINELAGGNLDTFEIILLILSRLNVDLKQLDQERLDSFYKKMETLILEMPPRLLDQNIPSMFSKLKASGFSLSLLSNTGFIKGKTLDIVLDQLGILEFFSFQVYSDEIGVSKPNKKAFEVVFREVCKLKDCKKENILHIGDNEIADVKGAEAFGFQSILVSPELYSIK